MTPSGYDFRPARPGLATAALFVFVVVVASTIAYLFRWALHRLVEYYAHFSDPTRAAAWLPKAVLFGVAAGSVAIAATIGHVVQRHWASRTGIDAVAASARGEGRSISFRATWLRVAATWLVSAGLVSIGRETAIVEAGGSLGAVAGRRSGGRGDSMAAAGIAAAFAAAYHAPFAALLYAEEHLRVRQSKRAMLFVVLGAAGGFVVTLLLFDADPLLPDVDTSLWNVLGGGLLVVVPVVIVSRLFLQLRVRVTADALVRSIGCRRWMVVGALSLIAGLSVMIFPLASGNGMEALRRGPSSATVTLGLALVVGKLVGTTAALGAGAPGGVLSPTLGVAAGCALLIDDRWEVMVAAMAVGVAVGMRSPLVAVFLIPELLGDYRLVLPLVVVVAVAYVLDRGIDVLLTRLGRVIPTGVYDEDA